VAVERSELQLVWPAGNPNRCPVTALTGWNRLAAITDGPLFRPVGKNNQAAGRPLHPESIKFNRPARAGQTDAEGLTDHLVAIWKTAPSSTVCTIFGT
jgi:hypothetical protein